MSQIHKDKKVGWWLPEVRAGEGREEWDLLFSGQRVSVWKDEKLLEMVAQHCECT